MSVKHKVKKPLPKHLPKPVPVYAGVFIHGPEQCVGHACPFHHPSSHHMRRWPKEIRQDKLALVERICEHGVGHPDPDSLSFLVTWAGEHGKDVSGWLGIHGCDGCCSTPTTPEQPDAADRLQDEIMDEVAERAAKVKRRRSSPVPAS